MKNRLSLAIIIVFMFVGCNPATTETPVATDTIIAPTQNLQNTPITSSSNLNTLSPAVNERQPDIIGDPFTPITSTAVEFLLDFSFSTSSKSIDDVNYSCLSNLEVLRKQIPLFFFSVAHEKPELDIDIGASYFNGNFRSDPDGYYQLILLGKSFHDDTNWYRRIKDLNDTQYGENYAKSINRSLANLDNSEKQNQFVVFIGDGTYRSIDQLQEIKNTMNVSDNQQLRIILICTDKNQREGWEDVFHNEGKRVKIDFIDPDTNSYSWLYQLSQEILGVEIQEGEQSTIPNFWLNAGTVLRNETAMQSPESVSPEGRGEPYGQVSIVRTKSVGPVTGDSKWRVRAVQLLEGGRIEINDREYVLETSKEIPNSFSMNKFHPIQSDCEPQIINVKYTGLGPLLYWIEQKKPVFSTPTLEMSGFSVASSSVTAVIKMKVKDVDNLSNLEMCYQPFLKIGNEIQPSPLISSSCNSIICAEQSYLTFRYQLETSFSKNAAVHFGYMRNSEIVSESRLQPAPFIIQTDDNIKGHSAYDDNDRFTDSIGKPVKTYIFDIPVFFYDPIRWDISIQATSTLGESLLKGRKVSEINEVCPNKQTAITATDNRMKYAISSENDYVRFFFASNVAWDFNGDSGYQEYCGFESFRITWVEKETNETIKWTCDRSRERHGLVCNLTK